MLSEDYLVKKYEDLEMFLVNIFSQTREDAYRRVRYFCAELHESYLKEYMEKHKKDKLVERVRKAIKR